MRVCSKKQNELTTENQILNKNKSKGGGVVRVLAADTEREREITYETKVEYRRRREIMSFVESDLKL